MKRVSIVGFDWSSLTEVPIAIETKWFTFADIKLLTAAAARDMNKNFRCVKERGVVFIWLEESKSQ